MDVAGMSLAHFVVALDGSQRADDLRLGDLTRPVLECARLLPSALGCVSFVKRNAGSQSFYVVFRMFGIAVKRRAESE